MTPLEKIALAGAAAAGVKRILLIGTVYPFGRPQSATVIGNPLRNRHTFEGGEGGEEQL